MGKYLESSFKVVSSYCLGIWILVCIPSFLKSQPSDIDSLKMQAAASTTKDTVLFNRLYGIAKLYYKENNPDSVLPYAKRALALAKQLNFSKGEGLAYQVIGLAQTQLNNYAESIENLKLSATILKKTGDLLSLMKSVNGTGIVYYRLGNLDLAMENFINALKLSDQLGDKNRMGAMYNNIGEIFRLQGSLDKALDNYYKAVALGKETNDQKISNPYNNIGIVYLDLKKYDSAVKYTDLALAIRLKNNDKTGIALSYNNMGLIFLRQQKFAESFPYYDKAVALYKEAGDKEGLSLIYYNIAVSHREMKQYAEAEKYAKLSLELASGLGSLTRTMEGQECLSSIYKAEGKHELALEQYKAFIVSRDSLNNLEDAKRIFQEDLQYNFDKKEAGAKAEQEKKDILVRQQSQKQKLILFAVALALFFVVLIAVIIGRSLVINRKKNRIIELQKASLEAKHKEITDSINYAERIQRSFLATKELLDANLHDYFVLFKPKDIVSGDFYWAYTKASHNSRQDEAPFYFVTADSTGHGVPGAIMSLLNITSIESAIKDGFTQPDEILNATRKTIIERLKQDGSTEGGKDGMDCSLCMYDFKNKKLTVAAANNPVWIVRDAGSQSPNLIEIKPDKMPVGRHEKDSLSFTRKEVQLESGDVVYTLTDGFPDQFGGQEGKKFMSKNLKELLAANAHLPMEEQKNSLETAFKNWMGKLEQIDDVCIIGVKIQ